MTEQVGRPGFWKGLWAPPNWQSLSIGRQGELMAANARLWLAAVAAALAIAYTVNDPGDPEPRIVLVATFATTALSGVVRSFAGERTPPWWLGWFSCILDVSIVSMCHGAFVLAGQPLAATNGRVFFTTYLLFMGLTGLRQDARLCLVSGLCALVQYGTIIFWVQSTADVATAASEVYGPFRWDNQISRLTVLALAALINTTVVRQGQRHSRASLHDPLTNLPNRRYAEVRLEDAVAGARRAPHDIVIALADVDCFREVNDQYGHAAGDRVLQEIALRLRSFCRSTDVVARYGGDEFLVIFASASLDGAVERIGEFMRGTGSRAIALSPSGGTVSVTLSFGVAACPGDGMGVVELTECADSRLTAAKRQGRNRVIAARPLKALS